MSEPINHKEAEELALLKREESNLARCYLDMKLQAAEMKKLLTDIHEAGRGLFLQLDPRGGIGERLSIVWDRLTPYAEKRVVSRLKCSVCGEEKDTILPVGVDYQPCCRDCYLKINTEKAEKQNREGGGHICLAAEFVPCPVCGRKIELGR